MDEGDTVRFQIECEEGSFPVETISFFSNLPIKNYTAVKKCDDEFIWSPPYDFIKETAIRHQKLVLLYFVGTNKFFIRDTAVVRLICKGRAELSVSCCRNMHRTEKEVHTYIFSLKYSFVQLDKKVKSTKTTRTTFDMTTSGTTLGRYRTFFVSRLRCPDGRQNPSRCRCRPRSGKRNGCTRKKLPNRIQRP